MHRKCVMFLIFYHISEREKNLHQTNGRTNEERTKLFIETVALFKNHLRILNPTESCKTLFS